MGFQIEYAFFDAICMISSSLYGHFNYSNYEILSAIKEGCGEADILLKVLNKIFFFALVMSFFKETARSYHYRLIL